MSDTEKRDEVLTDIGKRAGDVLDNMTDSVKEIEVDGYKFSVDTDLLDDVDSLEFLERIENKGQVAAVLPLLKHILGESNYKKLQAYFIDKDAKDHAAAHPEDKDYRPRMRMGKMQDVYIAILDKFDPKG